jgi:hypothetical protein
MRSLLIALVALLATEAGAVEVLSLGRQVSYSGGLEEPGMISDSQSSSEFGAFVEDLSDVVSSPPDAEAAAAASQSSFVSTAGGGLVINVDADVSARAVTLAEGTIADALAQSRLEIVFSTDEITNLTVDIVVVSSLGPFFDGTGVGDVATSHVASFLLCVVGGGCLADLFVEDISDNLSAIADGVRDSIELPPGSYEVELLAISQAISRDDGSVLGSAGFSGEITVKPVPEPDTALSGLVALSLTVALATAGRLASRTSSGRAPASTTMSRSAV